MKKRKGSFLKKGMTAVFCLSLLFFLQKLLVPKFVTEIKEGSLISEYYAASKDNDVIFVGDCEAYECFVPSALLKKFGIRSFIRGSASQRIWQSYYLMKETLRYEKPKAFVLSVQELRYGEPAKEEYNRMSLDGMKWSKEKWDSVFASKNEEESIFEYLFPILRFKGRIAELKKEDFLYLFKKPAVSDRGYLKNTGVKPMEGLPVPKPLGDPKFSEKAMTYLQKITDLCKEEGVDLILMKAPIPYPHWYEEWDREVESFAKKEGLTYLNFYEKQKETGIDYRTDTYDAGLHLNYQGALKLTDYMGNFLTDRWKGH